MSTMSLRSCSDRASGRNSMPEGTKDDDNGGSTALVRDGGVRL